MSITHLHRQPAVFIQCRASRSALTQQSHSLKQQLTQARSALSLDEHWVKGQPLWVGAYQGEMLDCVPDALRRYDSRNLRFALTTLHDIEDELREHVAQFDPQRLAIIVGTSTSGISDNETALREHFNTIAPLEDQLDDTSVHESHRPSQPKIQQKKQEMDALAKALQLYLGWTGLCYSVSTACSSSAKAMAAGQRLLNADLADAVLVAGVDTLSHLTLNGFASLENLSSSICRPCGDQRDGINIGEAASLFLLSKQPAALMLLSAGESMDAWHISAPHPEGRGAVVAMQSALHQAGLQANQISYLNLHGTATTHNDAMEIKAVRQVFQQHPVAISSSKHQTGHCLGAAGALEAYICMQVLADQDWLPLHHQGKIDPELADMNYVTTQYLKDDLGSTRASANLSYVMSNSFAFGGSNISLIFGTYSDEN